MAITILTGPAASGKNTIANLLAQKQEKVADIDVDLIRWMYRIPHFSPWEGEQGIEQMRTGAENACLLAESFQKKGLEVFISDVVLNQTINIYQQKLGDLGLTIIQLMPTLQTTLHRLHNRPHTITDDEAKWVYQSQEDLIGHNHQIESSQMMEVETLNEVMRLLANRQ